MIAKVVAAADVILTTSVSSIVHLLAAFRSGLCRTRRAVAWPAVDLSALGAVRGVQGATPKRVLAHFDGLNKWVQEHCGRIIFNNF